MAKVLYMDKFRNKKNKHQPVTITYLQEQLDFLNIKLILNDTHGAKDIKRKIAELENRINEMRSKQQ